MSGQDTTVATDATVAAADEAAQAAAAQVDVDEPDEGDETPAEGGGAPAEGETPAAEKTPEQVAAEAEAKKAADEKFAAELPELLKKIPEDELKKLGTKYANGTMAAARRAENRTKAVTDENTKLKAQAAQHDAFVESFQKNPHGAIRNLGFKSIREFLDHCASAGEKEPTETDRLSEIEKRIKDREDREKAEALRVQVEGDKKAVADAIGADKKRWTLAAKPRGQRELWSAIEDYHKTYGSCPDEAVYALADEIEKDLREEFGEPTSIVTGQGQPAKTPAKTPTEGAAPAGKNSGKTLTNRGSSGAPAVTELSMDPDERRRQVSEQLRAEGLL